MSYIVYFLILSSITFLTNYIFLKVNKESYKRLNYYFLAILVQFLIILINIIDKNTGEYYMIILNLMISYFILDIIFILFYCNELFSKIIFIHHIISGTLVWIGINYGENYIYIKDICVACERANIFDNLLCFLLIMNIIKKNNNSYIIIRILYLTIFTYDRIIDLPTILYNFLKVSNQNETFGIYCIFIIIIPMSFRLLLKKMISLKNMIKKIDFLTF